jgi:hypothetical protein
MEESINVRKKQLWVGYKGVRFMGTTNGGCCVTIMHRGEIEVALYMSPHLSSPNIVKTCGWLGLSL